MQATITEVFVNCPRYITRQASSVPASHVPDANEKAPLAEWKKIELLQGVLPSRFRNLADAQGGTITIDEYNEKVANGEAGARRAEAHRTRRGRCSACGPL